MKPRTLDALLGDLQSRITMLERQAARRASGSGGGGGGGGGAEKMPAPYQTLHNGTSNFTGENGVWSNLPDHPMVSLPPMDRGVRLKITFGGMVKASTGYMMLGVQISPRGGTPPDRWVMGPRQAENLSSPETWGMHTPFANSAGEAALTGFKVVELPPTPIFTSVRINLQGRRNTGSGTHAANYTTLLVEFLEWID